MSTTYRGTVKTNEYALRHMIAPGIRVEVARGSARALREAFARFVDLMRRSVPRQGATAWFEVSDRHGVSFTGYDGAPTEWQDGPNRAPSGGAWTLTRPDPETRAVAPKQVLAR